MNSSILKWIPENGDFFDYRPVFSPDGTKVLYERTYRAPTTALATPTKLWICDWQEETPTPGPFISGELDLVETRADWTANSSATQPVTFAGTSADQNNKFSVYLADGDGGNVTDLPGNTLNLTYPCWEPSGTSVTAMQTHIAPGPQSVSVDLATGGLTTLTDNSYVFAGMPSVNQVNQSLAFAGQKNQGQPYNQDNNQIWVQTTESDPIPVSLGQGRAPWWSPDGNWICFESGRPSPAGTSLYQLYLLNMQDSAAEPIRIECLPGASQHGKFSPCGTKLACVSVPDGEALNRIAIVDISQIVGG